MKCLSCQAENAEGAEVCASCGQLLAGSAALQPGAVVASRYVVLLPLGRGGMGTVYKAHDRALDETVAMKVLRPEVAESEDMARRFRSEIKLARKVRHRNVCGIHEYGEDGPLRYITMEFIEGTDLKRLLRQKGALPPQEAFDVAIQLAKGLQAIHDVGIIHRDLKTSNVMKDRHAVVRLMDFGIAKQFGEGSPVATAVGHILGTPEYMSPEQARGEKIDFRSDLYALGIVIYEIFTGDVPFHGTTPIATIFKQLQEPLPLEGPAMARIPAPLSPVLRKVMAKDRAERYSSARELTEALRHARATAFPGLAPSALDVEEPSVTGAGTVTVARPQPSEEQPTTRSMPATVQVATPIPTPAEVRETVRPARARPVLRPAPPTAGVVPWLVAAAVIMALATAGVVVAVRTFFSPGPSSETGPETAQAGGLPPSPTPTAEVQPTAAVQPSPGGSGGREPTPARSPELRPPGTPVGGPAGGALPFDPGSAPPTPAPPAGGQPPLVQPPAPKSGLPAPPTPAPPTPAPPTPRAMSPAPTPRPRTPEPPTSAPAITAPPTPRAEAGSEAMGLLQLIVKPWAEVAVDGNVVGTTPMPRIPLSAGVHSVRLTHPEFKPLMRKVTIRPGDTTRLEIDLTWEGVPRGP